LQDNSAFTKAKESNITSAPPVASAWLGAAMAIKEDTSAIFRQATANNLLIVGQQEEVTTSLVASSMLSLDTQFPAEQMHMTVLDGTHGDATYASLIPEVIEHLHCNAQLVDNREVESAMQIMYCELQGRLKNGAQGAPTHFLIVNGLHRFRDLRRNEDDYGFSMSDEEKQLTPAQIFAELIKEGPALGIHIILATDTLTNLNRAVDRQGFREFDLRVLLQMGNNDSSNLIDSTAASKLGLHRALLYSEEAGTIEPFRPYSMPVVRDL
jgi:S-DNA-T family DNA segregation ATPase FtsK/SpoIIIE